VAERMSESEMRSRAFWSGTLSFGLVSIPVNLFPASVPARTSLRMVDESGTPLKRRYVCPQDEKEVGWDDLVRGYEIEKDVYVVVTDDELEALEPRKSREIDLRQFVPLEQLDPKFFERGYYLAPAGDSPKAYQLLAAIMEKSQRAGIATFVMRAKEYLIAIVAEHGILRAETMRFADEVRSAGDVGLPDKSRVPAADVKKMETEIRKLTSAQLSRSELEDRYTDRLLKLVHSKERKDVDVVEAPAEEAEDEEASADVIDLMEVLRRSLRSSSPRKAAGKSTRKSAAKSARKSSARKRKTA